MHLRNPRTPGCWLLLAAGCVIASGAPALGAFRQDDHGEQDHHHADEDEAVEAHDHDGGGPAPSEDLHERVEQDAEHDHAPEAGHDHARDHGDAEGAAPFVEWIGRFHPVVVHMPIALLIAAAAAEILLMITGAAGLAPAARFCLAFGALGAAVAAPLGWANAAYAGYEGELRSVLTIHRWLGTSTAVWALGTWGLAEAARRARGRRWRPWYRAALLLGAVAVGVTGHFGGTLVFGPGYYRW